MDQPSNRNHPSTRVLRPPGGGSSISFTDNSAPAAAGGKRHFAKNEQQSNIVMGERSAGAAPVAQEAVVQAPVDVPREKEVVVAKETNGGAAVQEKPAVAEAKETSAKSANIPHEPANTQQQQAANVAKIPPGGYSSLQLW